MAEDKKPLAVTVTQVNSYEIQVGDRIYKDFEKVGEFEGLVKFQNKYGILLVDGTDENCKDVFSKIFEFGKCTNRSSKFNVIKASPDFIVELNNAKAK